MSRNVTRTAARLDLAPLFLVSLASISFETLLTRYFAVALYAEFSYWIISIAMVGYSLSGVVLTVFKEHFTKRRALYFFLLPHAMLLTTLAGVFVLRVNPFNPLMLQNDVLWNTQVAFIFLYYAGLFPSFFLAGLFVGLSFMSWWREISRAYASDLLGAAAGSALILAVMFVLPPYHLPAFVFAGIFAVIILGAARDHPGVGPRLTLTLLAGSFAVLCLGMYYVFSANPLSVPEFKRLHAIMGIEPSRVKQTITSPSGYFMVVDDYLEFDDVAMTNNYSFLKIGAPPRSFGIYKDGERISSLVDSVPVDRSYIKGSLAWFPYTIRRENPHLLIGTNGGFLLYERPPGRGSAALEQQRTISRLVAESLRQSPAGIPLLDTSVFSFLHASQSRFTIVEMASDFLALEDSNRYALTRDAVRLYLGALQPNGILSIPVDISEFSIYALKAVATIASALREIGIAEPSRHIIVYRTAWECRILASREPFSGHDIGALRKYCADRSFDTSWYPGIDPASITIWNDLPPVSFDQGTVQVSDRAQDALVDDLSRFFSSRHGAFPESRLFDLSPSTMDRPFFFSISRIGKIGTIFARLPLIPRREAGYVINVVVLAQAALFGLVIMFLPMVFISRNRRRSASIGMARHRPAEGRQLDAGHPTGAGVPRGIMVRIVLYFTALGLGFFFIEIALIDKVSFFLGSTTTSFGVVLTAMLVSSGFGSWYSARFDAGEGAASRFPVRFRGLLGALPLIAAILLFVIFAFDSLMVAAAGLPLAVRLLSVLAVVAPLGFALGRLFPLGSSSLGNRTESLIPWAWAINGAFSVIAAPLANLASARVGWKPILAVALALYLSTILTFPGKAGRDQAG